MESTKQMPKLIHDFFKKSKIIRISWTQRNRQCRRSRYFKPICKCQQKLQEWYFMFEFPCII